MVALVRAKRTVLKALKVVAEIRRELYQSNNFDIFAIVSMMSSFCGQIFSQAPQAVHSYAFPLPWVSQL